MQAYQFRLKSVFIAVMFISLPCAWVSHKIHRANRQSEIAERLLASGIHYEEGGPVWIRSLLQCHFPITTVRMSNDMESYEQYFDDMYYRDIALLSDLRVIELYGHFRKSWIREEEEKQANDTKSQPLEDKSDQWVWRIRRLHPDIQFRFFVGDVPEQDS